MAKKDYKIEAPDGSILTINGPENASPEQLREAAQRAYAAKGGQISEPTKEGEPLQPSATQEALDAARETERLRDIPVERTAGESGRYNASLGFSSEGFGLTGQMTPREEDQAIGAARFIPTVAASYAFPIERFGTATAATIPAVTELLSSYAAGDSTSEAVGNAIIAAYPGWKIKEAERFIPAAVKEIFKEMTRISGTIFTSETAKGLIEGEGITGSLKRAIEPSNYTIPAAISTVVGPIRGWSAKSSYMGRLTEEVKADLRPLMGDEAFATAGMVNPEQYAALEMDFISKRPNHPITKKLQSLGPDSASRWARLFPHADTSADIAQRLKPSIEDGNQLAQERGNLVLLQQKNEEAQRRFAQAQSQGLPEAQLAKIEQEVIAGEAAIINQEVRTSFFAEKGNAAINGSGDAASTTQAKFVNATNRIFNSRSKAASAAYKETGIPFNEEFIPVAELQRAVSSKTRHMQTQYRNQILDSIEKAGGESGMISINQMKEMRSGFGTDFNSTDVKAINAFEKLANDSYSAITKRTQQLVSNRFGAEKAKALAGVNAWWGETSNLQNSKYMNQMLAGEPNKSLVIGLANDIAKGNFQSVKGYISFLNAVAKRAPDVADAGKSALINTAREGFINMAKDASGTIDRSKLFRSLTAASKFNKELQGAFPIESLGFGNAKQIRAINKTYQKYGLNSMSPEDLDGFYGNPMVREALRKGQDISKLVTKSAARSAFKKRVNEIVTLRAVGAEVDSSEYKGLLTYAKEAELSEAAQTQLVRQLEGSNPLVRFMSGDDVGIPKSAYGLTQDNAITNMLKGMPQKTQDSFISAVRETSPALLEQVKSRVVMDLLPNISDASGMGGHMWKVDMTKVRNMFDPATNDAAHPINILQKLMPAEEFIRFKSKMVSFARLSEHAQGGSSARVDFDIRNLTAAAALQGSGGKGPLSAFRSGVAELFNIGTGIRYRTAAKMLLDRDVASSVLMKIPLPITKAVLFSDDTELRAENMVKFKTLIQNAPQ